MACGHIASVTCAECYRPNVEVWPKVPFEQTAQCKIQALTAEVKALREWQEKALPWLKRAATATGSISSHAAYTSIIAEAERMK